MTILLPTKTIFTSCLPCAFYSQLSTASSLTCISGNSKRINVRGKSMNLISRRNKPLTKIRSGNSSSSEVSGDSPSSKGEKQFGYSRKDVILIGIGVTLIGVGLKSGLEFVGVDSLVAGNAVQLLVVLGLTVGWIATYVFRVSNKEMTYAQQLRDYESKVMEKRLEGLTEAELAALLEQVEEEKRQAK